MGHEKGATAQSTRIYSRESDGVVRILFVPEREGEINLCIQAHSSILALPISRGLQMRTRKPLEFFAFQKNTDEATSFYDVLIATKTKRSHSPRNLL